MFSAGEGTSALGWPGLWFCRRWHAFCLPELLFSPLLPFVASCLRLIRASEDTNPRSGRPSSTCTVRFFRAVLICGCRAPLPPADAPIGVGGPQGGCCVGRAPSEPAPVGPSPGGTLRALRSWGDPPSARPGSDPGGCVLTPAEALVLCWVSSTLRRKQTAIFPWGAREGRHPASRRWTGAWGPAVPEAD